MSCAFAWLYLRVRSVRHPRVTGPELVSALGQGPLIEVTTLHGYSSEVGYDQVMDYRRAHHRNHRLSTPERVSADDFAYAIGRSVTTLTRWTSAPLNLIPDTTDAQGMYSRAWAGAIAGVMADPGLGKVKRLSMHQANMLRQRVNRLDVDEIEYT